MPTLILTPRYTDDAQALWRGARNLGWNVERLLSWRIPEELKSIPDPVLYLEGLLGPTLAEEFGLQLIEPPINWLPRLPEEYRKRWIRLSTLGNERQSEELSFIKPPNDKAFPAAIYTGKELSTDFPDDMAVLVSEVVSWDVEFRCFILDRQLKTFSVYLRSGKLQRENDFVNTTQEEENLRNFVGPLLKDDRIDLPKATVIDVGIICDRGWAVIEQNAAWGSGLYGCNPEKVLEVLQHSAIKRGANVKT